jgi:flagellar motor protein MotB
MTEQHIWSWDKLSDERNLSRGAPVRQTNAWMISFVDLMSIVLALFVLLFSMSSIDTEKWINLFDPVGGEHKLAPGVGLFDITFEDDDGRPAVDTNYLSVLIAQEIQKLPGSERFSVEHKSEAIVIKVQRPEDLIKNVGVPLSRDQLQAVTLILSRFPNDVLFEAELHENDLKNLGRIDATQNALLTFGAALEKVGYGAPLRTRIAFVNSMVEAKSDVLQSLNVVIDRRARNADN